jgi:hypothetical protein
MNVNQNGKSEESLGGSVYIACASYSCLFEHEDAPSLVRRSLMRND